MPIQYNLPVLMQTSIFSLTISIKYDNLFLRHAAGSKHRAARRKVKEIVHLAQPYFLRSRELGTRINLQVKEIKHVNDRLRLRDSDKCKPDCQM